MSTTLTTLSLDDFPRFCGQWLAARGAESDVVVSSRIRLARNLRGLPFPTQMNFDQRTEVVSLVDKALGGAVLRVDLDDVEPVDRGLLIERHLISKELASGDGPRSVFFRRGERISLMVNEEDHLRIQVMSSGFELSRVWRAVQRVEAMLERTLAFAFDKRLGYLTACPTNVGTGMRVSVMLHLPALTIKDHISKVQKAVDHMNLTLRGLYGEHTQALGDFYQISNQATLGMREEELIATLEKLIPEVLGYERAMRKAILQEERALMDDRLGRALATLRAARRMSFEEMMQHLSIVRFATTSGVLDSSEITLAKLNELMLLCLPAHLEKFEGKRLSKTQADERRADLIRERLPSTTLNS